MTGAASLGSEKTENDNNGNGNLTARGRGGGRDDDEDFNVLVMDSVTKPSNISSSSNVQSNPNSPNNPEEKNDHHNDIRSTLLSDSDPSPLSEFENTGGLTGGGGGGAVEPVTRTLREVLSQNESLQKRVAFLEEQLEESDECMLMSRLGYQATIKVLEAELARIAQQGQVFMSYPLSLFLPRSLFYNV